MTMLPRDGDSDRNIAMWYFTTFTNNKIKHALSRYITNVEEGQPEERFISVRNEIEDIRKSPKLHRSYS